MIFDFGIIASVTKYYHYLVPVLPPLAIVIGVWLHPKLATVLLNDLFGIQSRAGCSCAGPYGHRLLEIDLETSEQYRDWVRQGYQGIKPGWCRVGFHYVMDDAEADYVIDAIDFLGRHGDRFIGLYDFDVHSGMWSHRGYEERADEFSLDSALRSMGCGGAAESWLAEIEPNARQWNAGEERFDQVVAGKLLDRLQTDDVAERELASADVP